MLRSLFLTSLLAAACLLHGQPRKPAEYLFVITFDGLRWQEVFGGADSVLMTDKAYNQGDGERLRTQYWAPGAAERRRKLMPFFWSTIEAEGRIFGNRAYGNRADNANPYWFSYPGYSEIFCGYADTAVNSNSYPPNPNTNVLGYLNRQPGLAGRIAAFGAWDAFDRILNEAVSGVPVVCGREACGGTAPSPREQLINDMKRDAYSPFGDAEQLDVFTHYAALEYLKTRRPRVLYVAYGETDEWAHHGHYRDYLDAARQTDQWIRELWEWAQADPEYRGKTALLITTDHGRGDQVKAQWKDHGQSVPDSHEIWIAAMGPGVPAGGEMKTPMQLYQQQVAQTLAKWLGHTFTAEHPVADDLWEALRSR
jgi:hypothetical protein